jgi:hypothetical protein
MEIYFENVDKLDEPKEGNRKSNNLKSDIW